jgi:hypothetical protein
VVKVIKYRKPMLLPLKIIYLSTICGGLLKEAGDTNSRLIHF